MTVKMSFARKLTLNRCQDRLDPNYLTSKLSEGKRKKVDFLANIYKMAIFYKKNCKFRRDWDFLRRNLIMSYFGRF